MKLSIIVPVYNSSEILSELIKQIEKNVKLDYEIILINDFSKDDSWRKIQEISNQNNKIKGINLKKNYGQHNAIAAGLTFAKGDYFVLMDDDLQHDPIFINDIVNQLTDGAEACYVKYLKRKHIYWKKLVSLINHLSSSFLAGKSLKIYTSSFKGFNRRIANFIIEDKQNEVFLDWIILYNSKNTKSVNVLHRERYLGKTNYNLKKLFLLWSAMMMNIKSNNRINRLIIYFIKIFIKNVLFKILNKKEFTEKFLIKDKTF